MAIGLLVLQPATLDDIPELTALWFEVFTDPAMRQLWPDTPGTRKWWEEANRGDMTEKPYQKYVKVIDPESKDANGRPRIVAYAKWDLAMPDERGPRFPPWHEDMDKQECDNFFNPMEINRKRIFGDTKHYYLDMLGTHPDYRGRGAGSMLIKYGCELADKNGAGAYVDASKAGAPLYAKFGFVDESGPDGGEVASMARRCVN
ncbi:Acyl-CoA N-acyltransferase, partial [Penicillium cinerascens]